MKWANVFMAENLEEPEIDGDLMTKEEKKELMDTVKIIKKGDPLWEVMEEDRIYYENTVRHEIYQEGQKKEKLEIAKKMKAKGQSLEFIQEITDLSMEEIEKLS